MKVLANALAVVLLSACTAAHRVPPTHTLQLPFGGRTVLPGHRVVAYYGAAQTPDMGILGRAAPTRIAPRLLQQARAYAPYGESVVPAFELIATVAQSDPGADGTYSASTDTAIIVRYLTAVRRIHGLLILDVQPGRASFLTEVRRYETFLKEPDVSLALDSEWSMGLHEVPARVIGGTTGRRVNGVSAYLSALIRRYDLPQKLLIVHQFTPDMVEHREQIIQRPGIALVFHIDGFGTRAGKLSKYRLLSQNRGAAFMGFKLFYRQDVDLLSPADVMRLHPPPDLVTYQ